jgi:fatty acid-binding protein DegV
MKIKMIFDSSCTKSKIEINKLGAGFIPLIIIFNGIEYESGVNIDYLFMKDKMNDHSKISTSVSSIQSITNSFRDSLKDNDHAVYLSLSKKVSSQNELAMKIAKSEEFKGKITVIDSIYTSPFIDPYVEKFIEKANEGNLEKLVELINYINSDQIG